MNLKNTNTKDLITNILEEPLENGISPIDYQYYNLLSQRKIILNEEVGENILEKVILPLIEMDNDGSGEPIELYLQTNGGAVWASMILCDIIDRIKTPLTIKIFGFALSMGALFAMAGHDNPNVKKVAYPFSVFLIHNGNMSVQGDKKKVKEVFKFDEKFEQKVQDYILSHSNITKEFYDEIADQEYYFLSERALELGIIDEIL